MELVELVHGTTIQEFAHSVVSGLKQPRKRISPRFLYDRKGSELFEQICELPEYYLTRTELRVLRAAAEEIAEHVGEQAVLIEFGSGASRKTRILLEAVRSPAAYVPIDISRDFLLESAHCLRRDYPGLKVLPVCGDFTSPSLVLLSDRLLEGLAKGGIRRVAFFPGSTIGNLDPEQVTGFLSRTASILGPGGLLLVGVDLIKDPELLRAAYNDARGITAEFNLNLLHRMNREAGASFDPSLFRHEARWSERFGRMEMHLVSTCDQIVQVGGEAIEFRKGESIHTESSYKYEPGRFEELAFQAGFSKVRLWSDLRGFFGVYLLRAEEARAHSVGVRAA